MEPKKKLRREDRAGHLDPSYAASLRAQSGERVDHTAPRPFVGASRGDDDLAEELAEAAVATMTSGEDHLTEDLEAVTAEERGGPFVSSTGGQEYALGIDASNPRSATREPFPKT